MIEIKTLFTDWHEVSAEHAKNYCTFIKNNTVNIKDEQKNEYINKNILRGATIEEKGELMEWNCFYQTKI